MTYYAVTNDPNELAHFGIKGMKWGIRRTDAQLGHPRHHGSGRRRSSGPKSEAYKKAESKLHKMMKSGIKKAEANWRAYNSPAAKEARFMKKAMQQARNGTLKYGKLTDDQVRRVTDRLALERSARSLGNTENPSYAKRLKMAVDQGIVSGVGQGTSAYIEERFRGRGRTTADIKRDKRMAKYESDKKVQRLKAENKVNQEYYEQAAKRGYEPGIIGGMTQTQSDRAKQLRAWTDRDAKEAERAKRQSAYYDTYIRTAAANRAKNRIPDKTSNNNNSNNSNNNNNGGNNENGQKNPQLPVSINIYTGNGRRATTPAYPLSPARNPQPGTVNPTNWVLGPDGRYHPPKKRPGR